MKIAIKNFGPISSFDFDLSKDFNVIFGKNNIGKSYAITAIYLMIKNLIKEDFNGTSFYVQFYVGQMFREQGDLPFLKLIDNYEKELIEKLKDEEIEITTMIEELLGIMITETMLPYLEKSFINSYSSIASLSNQASKLPFCIDISYQDFAFSISNQGDNLCIAKVTLFKPIFIKPANIYKQTNESENRITLYHNKKNGSSHIYDDIIALFKNYYVKFNTEITNLVNEIYFLPASRSGLYQALSSFSAVIAELSKSRHSLTNRIELPNISEPVSDYFLNLSDISPKKNIAFTEIVENLEQDILKGGITFNETTKKMVFTPKNTNIPLDLAFTSSMVSEIAPIVAYLKYIMSEREDSLMRFNSFREERNKGKKFNILFIEEPEAHLHPEIQVKLLEIFCKLSKLNVKIIMTSHSNYMFNKLSNLILDSQIDYEKVASYLMKAGEFGSVIDSISMKADADGIQDENFVDVAEMLYEERLTIYDKLNNQKNEYAH